MTTLTLQQRFAVAAAIGAAGGGVALAMIGQGKFGYGDAGFLRVASAGAFLAGLLVAGGFGGQGVPGLLRALLSFLGATVLGAVIAVLLMPFDRFGDRSCRWKSCGTGWQAALSDRFMCWGFWQMICWSLWSGQAGLRPAGPPT
ncbi:hypothetical protein ACFQFQ_08110 [Sulfitobacter porphyrae]|uniref:Uncharacterized protein n=1 Tax=Sulfitobacter porphyrae TaxID=1246864 RepID=A0ABW2B1B9_9RHOB